jgi:putative Mg2+ transporter-C (MgtC) family protein
MMNSVDFEISDLYKFLLAVAIGGAIGLEREFRGKSAGFRTIILITIGSTLFSLLSLRIVNGCDVDRIPANLVVGIGFLGAGVIFKEENRILGLTTASTIWTSAALGLGIGLGYWMISLYAAMIVLIVLIFLPLIERWIDYANQVRTYKITCAYENETLQRYEEIFKNYHLKAYAIKQSIYDSSISGSWIVRGSRANHRNLLLQLLADKNIKQLDF